MATGPSYGPGGTTGILFPDAPVDLGENPDGDAILDALVTLGLVEYTGAFDTGA